MGHPVRVVTAEELLVLPDSRYRELVRGVPRVSEPPGGLHGWIAARLAARLADHVERHGLGSVLVEAGYVLQRAPDTVRGPDVSFIGNARLPPERLPEHFIPGAPDLAIEILSPSDRWSDVEEMIADYFGAGARLVWVVDPGAGRVIVRYPDRPPRIVPPAGTLEGEELVPGFALPLQDLFTPRSC
jgi:Uma2 family endonuclease